MNLMIIFRFEDEQKSYAIIIDRRMDKWSSVRLLLSYLTVSVNLNSISITQYSIIHLCNSCRNLSNFI